MDKDKRGAGDKMSDKSTNNDAAMFVDEKEIQKALSKAVRHALRKHKRAGNPIAVWRDDKVVWIPPEEIPDFEDDEDDKEPIIDLEEN